MYSLGINAAFHDSSAALLRDGALIAAAEEERFTRIKQAKRPLPFTAYELPFHAIAYCLREAGITLDDVTTIAYSFDPSELEVSSAPLTLPSGRARTVAQWDPLFYCYTSHAPYFLRDGAPHYLRNMFKTSWDISERWQFVDHHLCHAASAYYPSPFHHAAILTMDGRGEHATTTYSLGSGNSIERIGEVSLPHSLGLLYESFTSYLGFLHSSDEYKVMALASYGKPRFIEEVRSLIRLEGDGRYRIVPHALEDIFGPARKRGTALETRHFDIAHSLQKVLEETVLGLTQWLAHVTDANRLCFAGGVALNCVLNSVLRDRGPFSEMWVQPAAGDSGTALGAAFVAAMERSPVAHEKFVMEHAYWGPAYSEQEIEKCLQFFKVRYRRADSVPHEVALLLESQKIVGWFQGRMEFGPRALGARSILASPTDRRMQDRLNAIKDREDFRPVAPAVIDDDREVWFRDARQSPFMLFVHDVPDAVADRIPAIRHIDGTARVQTVREQDNPLFYRLIREFKALTGVPVLVNTSFNVRGEPIVQSPEDGVRSFFSSPLDALSIGPFIVEKDHG